MDRLTPAGRSANMAAIRGKNTRPELVVRKLLHKLGFRFRLHRKDLPGSPDIVLPKYNLVVFVHGCFWHRHEGCNRANIPKSRVEYWQAKFARNIERDYRQRMQLKELGWMVLTLWECEATNADRVETALRGAIRRNR
jgi:DNA mismatch endonuclease (patch repair protein)